MQQNKNDVWVGLFVVIGIAALLTKPYSAAQLIGAVRGRLENSEQAIQP